MHFEFATTTQIIFGPGTVSEVPKAAPLLGRRALFVVNSLERSLPLQEALRVVQMEILLLLVEAEPTIVSIQEGVRLAREGKCDLVIGMGGGSTLDTGKAIAALLANTKDIYEYLEVVGLGKPLTRASIAFIAIPTTAGTGSEVTRNAVLNAPDQHVKVSMRSPYMFPRLAVVDPELTYSLPPSLTASTGLDALTQLIEPFVSNSANPLTDSICREGIRLAACNIRSAFKDGGNHEARENMALASLFGGMALANARLGAVHGFAGSIGGILPAPHGAICARLIPFVMEANLRALKARQRDAPALARYHEIARIVTGNALAIPEDGIRWISRLVSTLEIPPLSSFGLSSDLYPSLIKQAKKSSSMRGNPIELRDDELLDILQKAE